MYDVRIFRAYIYSIFKIYMPRGVVDRRRLCSCAFLGRGRSRAEKEAEVAILKSQATLLSASNKAKGMVALAEAEMKAVEGLAEKRRLELEWKRLEVPLCLT